MLDDFFFAESNVRECRQFGRLRVQILEFLGVAYREYVAFLGDGYRGTESELVMEFNFPGYHVEMRGTVVRLQIQVPVLPGDDVPDLVPGEVILSVFRDEVLQGAAVPDVQAVHGSDIQVSQGVLMDGADGVVRDSLLGGNRLGPRAECAD